MTCDELQAVAAELAAGALVGEDRAAAMAHVARCQACRDEVADLAGAVDGLLLLAPAAEPPVGFETRVLDAIGARPQRRRPRRRWPVGVLAAAAAVALVVGLLGGVALGRRSSGPSAPLVAVLHARNGQDVGRAVLSPGWMTLDVSGLGGTESYLIELDLGRGRLLRPGAIQLVGGRGSARLRLSGAGSGSGARVAAVRLVSPSGDQECEARFT